MTSPRGPPAVGETAGDDATGTAEHEPGEPASSVASDGETARASTAQAQPATTQDAGVQRPYDRGPIWALLLPPLVGLALSLWAITTPSYWRDEAATIAAVRRPFPDLIHMLGNVDAVH